MHAVKRHQGVRVRRRQDAVQRLFNRRDFRAALVEVLDRRAPVGGIGRIAVASCIGPERLDYLLRHNDDRRAVEVERRPVRDLSAFAVDGLVGRELERARLDDDLSANLPVAVDSVRVTLHLKCAKPLLGEGSDAGDSTAGLDCHVVSCGVERRATLTDRDAVDGREEESGVLLGDDRSVIYEHLRRSRGWRALRLLDLGSLHNATVGDVQCAVALARDGYLVRVEFAAGDVEDGMLRVLVVADADRPSDRRLSARDVDLSPCRGGCGDVHVSGCGERAGRHYQTTCAAASVGVRNLDGTSGDVKLSAVDDELASCLGGRPAVVGEAVRKTDLDSVVRRHLAAVDVHLAASAALDADAQRPRPSAAKGRYGAAVYVHSAVVVGARLADDELVCLHFAAVHVRHASAAPAPDDKIAAGPDSSVGDVVIGRTAPDRRDEHLHVDFVAFEKRRVLRLVEARVLRAGCLADPGVAIVYVPVPACAKAIVADCVVPLQLMGFIDDAAFPLRVHDSGSVAGVLLVLDIPALERVAVAGRRVARKDALAVRSEAVYRIRRRGALVRDIADGPEIVLCFVRIDAREHLVRRLSRERRRDASYLLVRYAAHLEVLAAAGGDGNAVLRVLRVVDVLAVVAVAAKDVADELFGNRGAARTADVREVAHEIVAVEDLFLDAHEAEKQKSSDACAVRADAAVEVGRKPSLASQSREHVAHLVRKGAVVVRADHSAFVLAPSKPEAVVLAVVRSERVVGSVRIKVLVLGRHFRVETDFAQIDLRLEPDRCEVARGPLLRSRADESVEMSAADDDVLVHLLAVDGL